MLPSLLEQLAAGRDLSRQQMAAAIDAIMRGECAEPQIAQLLTLLRTKVETVAELAGAADAMRHHMTPIRCRHRVLIDTCGTGGDASGTFNISTAAALVTAAAGVPVAKHGNRGITSRSGSADVLATLGVNIQADVAQVEQCLDQLGVCFCFAPLLHPSMQHVAAVRRKLGGRTIFNLLGPLCNPASAPFQLLGAGAPNLRPLLAEALALLDTERSLVVCGDDGLDEVTLAGGTRVTEVASGQTRQWTWTPEEFGLRRAGIEPLRVDGAAASARLIQQVLDGNSGPPRDIVVLNAAAALWTVGAEPSPSACAARAALALDSGAARELLSRLVRLSHVG